MFRELFIYQVFSSDFSYSIKWWLPCWLSAKKSSYSAGDAASVSGLEKSPGEGNGNPLQSSCLGNPMDRGGWQAAVHGVARVGHNLATKPPLPSSNMSSS